MMNSSLIALRSVLNTLVPGGAYTAIMTAALMPCIAFAQPIVTGNVVNWPDNDWYQLVRADNYESVCEGRAPCTVEPGEYIAINLTTGERFDPFQISGTLVQSLTVDGNVISWPDDGWYQVQNVNDYTSICDGGESCTVPPGTYKVINHTLGVRYDNVVVEGQPLVEADPPIIEGDEPAVHETITVTGNLIEWPDNGWYQVLNSTFDEVCGGTENCTVDPGTYIVINHTTGERFENVGIDSEQAEPPSDTAYSLDNAAEDILKSLVGYQTEQLSVLVEDMAFEVISSSEGIVLSTRFSNEDNESGIRSSNTERVRYTCAGGGEVTLRTYRERSEQFGETGATDSRDYSFTDCRHNATSTALAAGSYALNGNLVVDESSSSGTQFTDEQRPYNTFQRNISWSGFTLQGPDSLQYEVEGYSFFEGGVDSLGENSMNRSGYIFNYTKSSNEQVLELIVDNNFTVSESIGNGGTRQSFGVTVEGTYAGQKSENFTVTVDTNPSLSRNQNPGTGSDRPFSGTMQFDQSDGALLQLNANPIVRPQDSFNTLLFTSVFYPASGDSIVENQITYQTLMFEAPNCAKTRNSETGKIECSDEGTFFIP